MEKPKLQRKELEDLYLQYFSNNEYLDDLVKTKKSPVYKTGTEKQRKELDFQVRFLKIALNDVLRVLIDHGHYDAKILKHAVKNRNLKFKTRWQCYKILSTIPFKDWL